jgi:serine phosphatase RsbU (regulator of sigma subunit)
VAVAPGSTLLLFTDGLVERRDSGIDEGRARLRELVAAEGRRPLGELCDRLLAGMLPAGAGDDVALLAVRTRPAAPSGGGPGGPGERVAHGLDHRGDARG